ncbi:MAG: hypothetical protein KA765_12075, partial [Thermoflexales bacterium]|nr:hypothetical protein [Thermoflexales bacterium]
VLGAWVHDTSNHPQQNQGALYSVYFDGASWGAQTPVVDNASILVTDPAIAFAGYGKAVAVFAANSPNATQPVTWSQVSQQLATQTISYTVWNGSAWSAPAKLASGGGDPRGRVTLAGDPYHNRVLAAWVRDQSPDDTLKYWTLEYSWFNANTNTWSPVKALSTPMIGETDAEVSLAFDSTGKATAVWVRQGGVQSTPTGDSPFNNNDLRHLVIATWNPATDVWTTDVQPDGLPTGALMPSIALDDQDRPMLAYALYLHDRDGVSNTGLGNNNYLGYAVKPASGDWAAHTVLSVRGVERPRVVMLPEQQAAIVYRGFGEPGTTEYNGVAMAAVVDLQFAGNRADASQAITAGLLTGGNSWMHDAVALKPSQSSAGQPSLITLGVYNLGGAAASARAAGANLRNVSLPGDEVLATQLPVLPDLSVAVEDIVFTQTLPLSGTLVPISVTVRNLGLARTHQAVTVRLILDADTVEEQELMSGTIPIGLMFNGTAALAGTWRATSGYHRLTARVSPPIDDDVAGANNEATAVIGVPATPTDLAGAVNVLNQRLGLAWQPVSGPAMSHYRVYRAEGTGTLTKLGDTTVTWFQDKTVQVGRVYRYAVTAVSDAGVESPRSAELTLGTRAVYLPLVRR